MRTQMKHGFTMIELVFVIVILGILAAVAVPKLSATRTDAVSSKMATNMGSVLQDVGTTFTSQGSLSTWASATNVSLMTDSDTKITDSTPVTTAVYLFHNDKQCIKFVSTIEGNLTISKGSDTSDTVCKSVQAMQKDLFKSHIFGGTTVKY